ncbi:hybrid sensor histidine kinase/response regulator [Humisphaera borealis]|uniref:histidine kinase n=1 Tax=Humisphaera borealis TaxID=2807512 RepID=A0A7M2WXG4_9BACT|nr:hybrid sensor histidine kinase/response regulator [Humisphaera borealis]QOV90093.1 response regulator [Humisphaera borealis]
MADQPVHKILVLDDDEGLLALCRRVLERAGHSVITANSRAEAERQLTAHQSPRSDVGLVVVDYQLSGPVTGLDFFRELAARGNAPAAILVTGFSDEGRVLEALRAGVRDVVRKTDDFLETLPVTVERVLRQVIAERKALEADALRDSEQRLRLALETGGMGAWEYEPFRGDLKCSDICLSHFGLPAGKTPPPSVMLEYVHPDDIERITKAFTNVVRLGGECESEFRVVPRGQPMRWLIGRAKLITGRSGKGPTLVGVTLDLTSRKLAEEELRRSKEAAEAAAEKARAFAAEANAANQAKDEFLAVLSHELRTPLTPVLTTAQNLSRDTSLPDSLREAMVMIRRNVELEARLIDDLLDLTRISRGKLALSRTRTNLHEAITDVLRICEGDIHGKGLKLELDLSAKCTEMIADAARLRQILWNLVKNAVKFTPAGGLVAISTTDQPGDNGNHQVQLTVRDSGIGIAPDLLPKVFDAFEQGEKAVTRKFGGLGLGLAISRALVALHGGTITAQSAGRDQGATFVVVFPASIPRSVVAAPADPAMKPASKPSRRRGLAILLVEDHPDTAAALGRFLGMVGHDVRLADTVAGAVRELRAQQFDLLISDIGLPDGSGLDLMRQVRDFSDIRGVVLSGFGTDDDVRRSREAGFELHLTKPVSLDVLERAIAETPAVH